MSFASSRNIATFAHARLGQIWQLLTPLLNAAVYYLLFGLLLQANRGVENYEAFLIIGVFVFTYTQRSVHSGTVAISGNLNMIRALHFPRATLPLAFTLIELQQLMVSVMVMLAIVLVTGEPVTWAWLLLLPILLLQTMFNTGASLAMARVGARYPDIRQLLPFMLRAWLYVSGVFYSVDQFADRTPRLVQVALEANPGGVYLELVRGALLRELSVPGQVWAYAVGWAVVVLLAGFWYFYRAEETYGRG